MTQNQLDHIHDAIRSGLVSLNMNLGKCDWHPTPRQPNLVAIANLNTKGCGAFYRILRSRANLKGNTANIEQKWHLQLQSNLSVTFWHNAWRLHASMQQNNQLKWLQYQILRNCLFTNNRLAEFKPWISDMCDLCNLHIENPMSLFSQCPQALVFWSDIRQYLEYFGHHDLLINRLQILFGIHTESFDSVKNISILVGKRTIWISKLKKISPTLDLFKYYLKDYLIVLRFCHYVDNTSSAFNDQWGNCFWNLQGYHGPQLPPGDGEGDG